MSLSSVSHPCYVLSFFRSGYHIFAAAVVAHFDPEWGRNFFERVLLLVRNIANPSEDDTHFPVLRHKDPYQGHSWASGIPMPPYLNGRNQESSSEALAGYEAVAIYGQVMSKIFATSGEPMKLAAAERVRRVGKLLTTTELRSTKRYYHIDRTNPIRSYPVEYTMDVIGMMWQTMAQFQTWFGNAPYLVYGIQLMPLTPIAEERDTLDWIKAIFPAMQDSCNAFEDCEATGWSIQILGALATAGHPELALEKVLEVPSEAFDTAGGDGHSLSNSLWYISTRPVAKDPLVLEPGQVKTKTKAPVQTQAPGDHIITDCHQPETCTDFVLDTVTDLYTCRQRIQWLMWENGMDQLDACAEVATYEFPDECGACNPSANATGIPSIITPVCPPCTDRQCRSDLNRCPVYERTYVCTAGANTGGCSGTPWHLESYICQDCCELSDCPAVSLSEIAIKENGWGDNGCPPCSPKQCHEKNVCPPEGAAPYLCLKGASEGGCSTRPWALDAGDCDSCCTVAEDCDIAKVEIHQ